MGVSQLNDKAMAYAVSVIYILIVGSVLALTIVELRWTYVVGIALAVAVMYVLLVWRRFEIILVSYFASALIVEHVFRGGIQAGRFEIGYREFVLVALLLGYFWHRRQTSRRVTSVVTSSATNTVLTVLFGQFVFFFLVSSLVTEELVVGARQWITFGLEAYVIFWLTRSLLRRRGGLRTFVTSMMMLIALISVNENFKMVLGFSYIPYRYSELNVEVTYAQYGLTSTRLLPILTQTPFAGALMASFFPLALVLVFHEKRLWARALYAGLCISLLYNIVFYLDRGTWLACGAALVALAILSQREKTVWLASGLLLMTIMFAVLLIGPRIPALSWLYYGPSDSATLFQNIRLVIWGKVLEVLPHVPLFGVGWGVTAWSSLLDAYSTTSYPHVYGPGPHFWHQPHNSYLHLLLAAGFPTLLSFVSILLLTFWRAIRSLGSTEYLPNRPLLLGTFAGLLALLGESVLDVTLWLTPMNVLLWILVGAVWGVTQSTKRVADRHGVDVHK